MKLIFAIICMLALVSCGKKLEDSSDKSSNNDTNLEASTVSSANKQKLLDALSSNDTTIVRQALNTVTNIKFHFENGETPLTFAIKYTKPEIVLRLILTKQILNLENKDGQLPINLIIQSTNIAHDKKLDLCHQMLKGDLNLDKKDSNNIAPLLSSIIFNEESIGIYLVKNGANVDAETVYRISMASFAQRYGLTKLESLIRDVSGHSEVNVEKLAEAIQANKTNFIQYLVQNYPQYLELVNEHNLLIDILRIQETPHRLGLLTYFLSQPSIKVDNTNENEMTPLMYASVQRQDLLKLSVTKLLRKGADSLARDNFNKTALIYAVENLNIEIVTRLKSNIIQKFRQDGRVDSEEISTILNEACRYLPRKRAASNINPYNGRNLRFQIGRALTCF
jgi:ankyrin repeat protein